MTMPLRVTPITRSFSGNPLTPLERVLSNSADRGDCYGGRTQITGGLEYMAHNIESAFVLVAKGDIPKARDVVRIGNTRSFSFEGEPWSGVKVNVGASAKAARSMAIKWLSIAAHIEAEEKVEAKKKADEEAAAKKARATRLNDISDLYFGKDFDELGDNKASAVKEIYRLEQEIADEGKDAA